MVKKAVSLLLVMLLVATPVVADDGSKADFQRAGRVDAIDTEAGTIVIDDIPYQLSASVVVHSTKDSRVSITRLRAGAVVGYKLTVNRQISELWLLPDSYNWRQRR